MDVSYPACARGANLPRAPPPRAVDAGRTGWGDRSRMRPWDRRRPPGRQAATAGFAGAARALAAGAAPVAPVGAGGGTPGAVRQTRCHRSIAIGSCRCASRGRRPVLAGCWRRSAANGGAPAGPPHQPRRVSVRTMLTTPARPSGKAASPWLAISGRHHAAHDPTCGPIAVRFVAGTSSRCPALSGAARAGVLQRQREQVQRTRERADPTRRRWRPVRPESVAALVPAA